MALKIDEEAGGIVVRVPVPRRASALIGWGGGLLLWGAAPLVLYPLVQSSSVASAVVGLSVWLVPGIVLLAGFLYRLLGREVVRLNKTRLTVRREVLGIGLSERAQLDAIRDMRHYPAERDARLYGLPAGGMSFEHGGGVHWFAEGISPADADRLVTAFQRRFRLPELRQRERTTGTQPIGEAP